jgi:NitT/TauT family transport system substrate-binding protein
MTNLRSDPWSRREFLGRVTGAVGTGFVGLPAGRAGAEAPPETTTITVGRGSYLCLTPIAVAEELLRAEGFTDVRYIPDESRPPATAPWGDVHFEMGFSASIITHIEVGDPILMLAGIHAGCYELIGTQRVRSVRDLKGKRVAVRNLGGGPHILVHPAFPWVAG